MIDEKAIFGLCKEVLNFTFHGKRRSYCHCDLQLLVHLFSALNVKQELPITYHKANQLYTCMLRHESIIPSFV